MPTEAYVKFEGADAGEIDAGTTQVGLESSSQVFAIDHLVNVPWNPEQGLNTGRRLHHPLVITKSIDKASPMLSQALCKKEEIKKVVLDFYTTDRSKYFSITLEKGYIVGQRTYVSLTQIPENGPLGHLEDIHVAYTKIIWIIEHGGPEYEDDWYDPLAL
jgi:type VI secretion system secreted protein Hcp